MPKFKSKMTVVDKGPGFQQLLGDIAGCEITVGVHGEEGARQHPDADMTVGEVMAMHELGLGGQKERSWLRLFLDQHKGRYEDLAKVAMQRILKGGSRKKESEHIGYVMTDEMRGNIVDGKIHPGLSPATIEKKGHGSPLLASAAGVNAITFKLKLRSLKSAGARAARKVSP